MIDHLPAPKNRIVVYKAGGEWQYYSADKLFKFLRNVGVSLEECNFVLSELVRTLKKEINTKELTSTVESILKQLPNGYRYAAIYTLKDSIRKMGPDGHNFESYVGRLFSHRGYKVGVGQFVKGECVEHEVDVVASNESEINLVECKFHNAEGRRSDVVVAMYSHARFMDIEKSDSRDPRPVVGWLATNTKLTIEALKYVKCKGLHLLSIENPLHDSITNRVRDENLFPISVISDLEPYVSALIKAEIVLLSDILQVTTEDALEIGIPVSLLSTSQNQASAILKR